MSSRRTHKSTASTETLEGQVLDTEASIAPEADASGEVIEAQVALEEDNERSTLGTAADAIRQGAASAKAAVGEVIPGVGKLVRKSIYGGFYYASYGVVFAALTVAKLLPVDNVVSEGVRDGASAACKAVEHQADEAAIVETNDAQAMPA
jgi:hypothetical protein